MAAGGDEATIKIKVEGESAQATASLREVVTAQNAMAESARKLNQEMRQGNEEEKRSVESKRDVRKETDQGKESTDRATRSIGAYVAGYAALRGVSSIINEHSRDLEALREAANKLAEGALKTATGIGPTAVQLFGSTADKPTAAAQAIIAGIAAKTGAPLDAATQAVMSADILGGRGGWFGKIMPGGPGTEANPAAVGYAESLAGIAQTYAITSPQQIHMLSQLATSAGAKTPEQLQALMSKMMVGFRASQSPSVGAFVAQIERASQLEGAEGVPIEDSIARAAQFRQVAPTEFLAARMERSFNEAAFNEKGVQTLMRSRGVSGRAAELSLTERIKIMEDAGREAAGDPHKMALLAKMFGGNREFLRSLSAFSEKGLAVRDAVDAEIGAIDGGDTAGAISDAAQSQQALAGKEEAGRVSRAFNAGISPGAQLQAQLMKDFGPETAAFRQRRLEMGLGGSFRGALLSPFGYNINEDITEHLALEEANRRALSGYKEARAAGNTGLSTRFNSAMVGIQDAYFGAGPSVNDKSFQGVMENLAGLLGELRDSLKQSDARGFGPVGNAGQ